jgi:hypothetical protein
MVLDRRSRCRHRYIRICRHAAIPVTQYFSETQRKQVWQADLSLKSIGMQTDGRRRSCLLANWFHTRLTKRLLCVLHGMLGFS